MTDRPDIPELPVMHFWYEYRTPSVWYRNGIPTMSIRRRTFFGSKQIISTPMPELIRNPEDNTARENAMRTLGKAMGL